MENEILINAAIEFLIAVSPALVGVASLFVVGRITGLWLLIENVVLRQQIRATVSFILQNTELDEMAEIELKKLNTQVFNDVSLYFSRKGYQIDTKKLEAVVSEVITDFFTWVDTVENPAEITVSVEEDENITSTATN